jgi:hypothetical protein
MLRRWSLGLLAGTLVALPLVAQADEPPGPVDKDGDARSTTSNDVETREARRPPWADEDWDGGPPAWADRDGPPDWVPGPPPWRRGEAHGHQRQRDHRPGHAPGPPWTDGEHRPGPPPWAGTERGGDGPPWAEDEHRPGPPPWAGHGRESVPGHGDGGPGAR